MKTHTRKKNSKKEKKKGNLSKVHKDSQDEAAIPTPPDTGLPETKKDHLRNHKSETRETKRETEEPPRYNKCTAMPSLLYAGLNTNGDVTWSLTKTRVPKILSGTAMFAKLLGGG